MAKINKIVVNQVEARLTSDAREPNTYAYDSNGILVRHDNDRVAKRIVGPGVLYGANKDSGDQTGLNTIKLIPNEDINTDQHLVVDPTSPNHIHLRAGGTIDASTADLVLGGEDTHVYISDSNDQVTLKGSGGQFLTDPSDPDNQIATIGDLVTNTANSWNPNFTDSTGTLAGVTATGNYNRIGNMVFFCVNVTFNGYTNLGTGQYQFDLPFPPRQTFTSRGGTLHNPNTDSRYHIASIVDIVNDGANAKAKLYYSGSTTDLAWKYNTPVSWAHNTTHFDMSGFYEILPE